jgi:two-component system cell cycle sensor histidine kinase/response regulator CckA
MSPFDEPDGQMQSAQSRDMTQPEQMERSLTESEAKLSHILNSAIAAIVSLRVSASRDWEYDYYSGGCVALYGYTPEELMADHRLWLSRLPPEDQESFLNQAFDNIFAQRDFTSEVRFRHRDGSIRWIASVHTCKKIAVDCWQVIAVNYDITARKQGELELQQREAFLRSIYDGTDQAIFVIDVTADGDFRYAGFNPVAERYGQRSASVIQGKTPEAAFGPEVGAHFRQHYSRCVRAGQSITYEECVRLEGQDLWTLTRLTPLFDPQGRIFRLVGTALDITDRRQLAAKNREQAALLDITSDAILVCDLDHRIFYWNQGAERLYGWSATETRGQWVNDLLHYDADQLVTITQTLLHQGQWGGEMQDYTRSGQPITVLTRWTLMRDQAGQPQSILLIMTDITEKRQLEAQSYQAQRLEALGTLTGGIAHDLNNVLAPILAMAQLLRLTQRQLPSDAQEQLQLIEQSARRGAAMVEQILALTRGSSEDPTPVVLVLPVLQEVVAIMQKSLPKSITVVFDQPVNSPQANILAVLADPTHLHQIIMNLCTNARDAMVAGGCLTLGAQIIHVNQAMAHLHLDARVGDYVVITVTDTGTGMTPEVRDLIFDPFFTTKAPGQGTGLGLAMVRGMVKSYGGFLRVASESGQGTEISVFLPALETAPGPTQPSAESCQDLQGNGERILVVDDDPLVQLTTQSLLVTHRYSTWAVQDGLQALAYYRQHQDDIALIILDITMPTMDGIELIRRLKALRPDVAIIAISGLPDNQFPARAAGADVFLAKPYAVDTLLNTVARLIQTRRTR